MESKKDSAVQGGMSILHTLLDGKHNYEVETVLKMKRRGGGGGGGGGVFARKGDRVLMVNEVSLHNVSPARFAEMLTEEAPMLTVHQSQPSSNGGCPAPPRPDESALRPVSKETTVLSFSLEMRREEDLEGEGSGAGHAGIPEGGGAAEEEEEEEEEAELFLVAMTNTSISVVTGRGCDGESPCHDCGGGDCNFKEVVMVAESSKVTLVPKGGMENFMKKKEKENVSIEHFLSRNYLRSSCPRNIPCMSPNPERMTIYIYGSDCTVVDGTFQGMPVVLNFTDSNCFLRCCQEGDRVSLRVESCEKQRLKLISRSNQDTLPFLFYMKAASITKKRRFESAACPGWFIHTPKAGAAGPHLKHMEEEDDLAFIFVIRENAL